MAVSGGSISQPSVSLCGPWKLIG